MNNTEEINIHDVNQNCLPSWMEEVKERQVQTFCNDITKIYDIARDKLRNE